MMLEWYRMDPEHEREGDMLSTQEWIIVVRRSLLTPKQVFWGFFFPKNLRDDIVKLQLVIKCWTQAVVLLQNLHITGGD